MLRTSVITKNNARNIPFPNDVRGGHINQLKERIEREEKELHQFINNNNNSSSSSSHLNSLFI
ncbi:hypothetical protein DFA_02377 [Cavenderia fasciculata]|uniref:Uncharacterized protein n=1 Tax=Cavenderia fasciculata TaxID=261658 RepID=F4PZA1_CACFS|nr:uncharacterized protein DFA_02377 [Cavenderia fasciculata]EGG19130.1 hypothetical protein DFA_02377 [Cavenderia fasciculata]|eukprot:XP_004366763.1 hypothetical protein DFA_02377 [Cavenderia fasciculata]